MLDTNESPQVFLSYAKEDILRVEKLYNDLKLRDVNVWWDNRNLEPGSWKPQITKAIARSRYFLICISHAALRKTGDRPGFQDQELNIAWEIANKQDERSFTITPIRLDNCDRGDNRLSIWQQYDLFENWDETADKLSVYFGGKSLNKKVESIKLKDDELIKSLDGKFLTFWYANEFEKALTTINTILILEPDRVRNLYTRGSLYKMKGDYDNAMKDYFKAIELAPKNPNGYCERGDLYKDKGELDNAIKDYNMAIELDPEYTYAYCGRGIAYNVKGELDSTIRDYNKAIELNPEYTYAYIIRGIFYKDKGDLDNAIRNSEKAIELDPQNANYFYIRGNFYEEKGDLGKAIVDYNKAIELNPNDASAYSNRGGAYRKKRDLEKAIADYDKAIELNSNDAYSYIQRGNVYKKESDLYKLNKDLQDERKPINFNSLTRVNHEIVYETNRYLEMAINDYNKAIEINPVIDSTYLFRGTAYEEKGMLKEAEQDFIMYKKLKIN